MKRNLVKVFILLTVVILFLFLMMCYYFNCVQLYFGKIIYLINIDCSNVI